MPAGQQSGLRIIVLFTDGASNSVPGNYDQAAGQGRALRTWDFPNNGADPDNQTHANPNIDGLYNTATGNTATPVCKLHAARWNSNLTTAPESPFLPLTELAREPSKRRHPDDVSVADSGVDESTAWRRIARRGLRNQDPATGRYPAEVFNINNAARNLVEIIVERRRGTTTATTASASTRSAWANW